MEFLTALFVIAAAAFVGLLGVIRLCVIAATEGLGSALRYTRQCALVGLPLWVGLGVIVFGFSQDPFLSNQDETHAQWLAARKLPDIAYFAGALISACGVICLSVGMLLPRDPGIESGGY